MDRVIPKIPEPSNSPFNPWLWRMAWRDSRRSRRRLLLFMSAIVLGIAALVAINSFSDNLSRSINDQAKELVGADLVLSTGRAPTAATRKFLDGIGQRRTYEVAFPSMVFFPGTGRARLAQVKALQGDFPYYGLWETTPAAAANRFRKASRTTGRVALVDEALLAQFGAKAGDSVKVGNLTYFIVGSVQKTPGQTAIATTVAPACSSRPPRCPQRACCSGAAASTTRTTTASPRAWTWTSTPPASDRASTRRASGRTRWPSGKTTPAAPLPT
jgi:putative ABC transport system permease protein